MQKKLYLGGGGGGGGGAGGLLTCAWIITEIYHPTLYLLTDDDMFYTYVNMYIAFVIHVMDVGDRDQV